VSGQISFDRTRPIPERLTDVERAVEDLVPRVSGLEARLDRIDQRLTLGLVMLVVIIVMVGAHWLPALLAAIFG
jgi:hypothetical protein